ncbi:MAG TPA: hypothetical protein PLV92_14195, partial [Pirellulaceae bacterium]|nr:hypothetical protein [Pirellulaceae bacterium]
MAEEPAVAPVKTVFDDYHGTRVADPYRYMESFTDPSVQAWVKNQATYAQRKLGELPGRAELLARIAELDAGRPYNLSGITRLPNGDLFYFKQAARE